MKNCQMPLRPSIVKREMVLIKHDCLVLLLDISWHETALAHVHMCRLAGAGVCELDLLVKLAAGRLGEDC